MRLLVLLLLLLETSKLCPLFLLLLLLLLLSGTRALATSGVGFARAWEQLLVRKTAIRTTETASFTHGSILDILAASTSEVSWPEVISGLLVVPQLFVMLFFFKYPHIRLSPPRLTLLGGHKGSSCDKGDVRVGY
jgi:hypothetical protein